MDPRIRTFLIRSVFLFFLSMALVAGFWFHSTFYQFGFANLLIGGGFVTFLVILAARMALSGELPRGRPAADVACTLDEGDRLLRDVARLLVRPAEGPAYPGVGQVLRARYDTGPEFARLLIVDARRSFLGDVTDEDARQAGYRSAAELRDSGAARWRWRPSDSVTLIHVRRLGATR